jgi:glucose-6-phosphate isomerase
VQKNRQSITLTVDEVSPFTVGVLIALFERTVGLYAHLVNINAYHQPGVEAGKKAAGTVLALQTRVVSWLTERRADATGGFMAADIASAIGVPDQVEVVFKICQHLVSNPGRGVKRVSGSGTATRYSAG